MKAYCPRCDKTIRAVVPAAGDGFIHVYVRHGGSKRCGMSRMPVPDKYLAVPETGGKDESVHSSKI